jgi:hypothetical protein
MNTDIWFWGFCMVCKFADDVSGAAVDVTIEDGTHSGSRNVVGKLTLHTVQKSQNQISVLNLSTQLHLNRVRFIAKFSQWW